MTSCSITPPSLKLDQEALLLQAVDGAKFTSEETESFNEEDCLFPDGSDGDQDDRDEGDCVEGAFSHYSRRTAQHHSVLYDIERPYASDSDDMNNSGRPQHMRTHSHIRPECVLSSSCTERSAPTSPDTKAMKTKPRKTKKSSLSIRESLLALAWERRRELNMLNEEMANFKEKAMPELLGRSSSDCGKINAENEKGLCHERLRRSRTRSLTDDDFEELRGCIDLGFRFDQNSVPDLCETLPALEVYCAVAQSLQESPTYIPVNSPVKQHSPTRCSSPSPVRSWKVSSPGDDPNDVKGRLRHWAQAVACDARLCC